MGSKIVDHRIPAALTESQWKKDLLEKLGLKTASFTVIKKSLDARRKDNIQWQMRIGVISPELKRDSWIQENTQRLEEELDLFRQQKTSQKKKILVAGSGPGGLFPALALSRAGYNVTWIERGLPVEERRESIKRLESKGSLNPLGNYAVGEGGAGTFSDGKLTSRSKGISKEKDFILNSYLKAGAPPEISYLTHPHLGSDNLYQMTKNLRLMLQQQAVDIRFRTTLEDLNINRGNVQSCIINGQEELYDYVVLAPGHSNYSTYRMLLKRGVLFRSKIFGLGFRAEHPQSLINRAQWGCESLQGVKAAEYRLTAQGMDSHRVYSFCMCPGGIVVPAAPSEDVNIVNGMSLYQRNGEFANAALICSFDPQNYLGTDADAASVLAWLEEKERHFKDISGDFRAPACTIEGFLTEKDIPLKRESSYPLGLKETELWKHLPADIIKALRNGLNSFSSKLKNYEKGVLLGLESKSSAPIQLIRSATGSAEGVDNLFITGEGSGWAGGIISSGADGLRNTSSLWH